MQRMQEMSVMKIICINVFLFLCQVPQSSVRVNFPDGHASAKEYLGFSLLSSSFSPHVLFPFWFVFWDFASPKPFSHITLVHVWRLLLAVNCVPWGLFFWDSAVTSSSFILPCVFFFFFFTISFKPKQAHTNTQLLYTCHISRETTDARIEGLGMDEWLTKTARGLSFSQMMSRKGVQITPASMRTDRSMITWGRGWAGSIKTQEGLTHWSAKNSSFVHCLLFLYVAFYVRQWRYCETVFSTEFEI